jgi:hypothetical protein
LSKGATSSALTSLGKQLVSIVVVLMAMTLLYRARRIWDDIVPYYDSSSVTHYMVECAVKPVDGRCPSGAPLRRVLRVRYKVFPDIQTVIEQPYNSTPKRLFKCLVIDSDNWRCSGSETATDFFGFRNGLYYESTEQVEELFQQVFAEEAASTSRMSVGWWTWIMAR